MKLPAALLFRQARSPIYLTIANFPLPQLGGGFHNERKKKEKKSKDGPFFAAVASWISRGVLYTFSTLKTTREKDDAHAYCGTFICLGYMQWHLRNAISIPAITTAWSERNGWKKKLFGKEKGKKA
jgi:hypothetical protein